MYLGQIEVTYSELEKLNCFGSSEFLLGKVKELKPCKNCKHKNEGLEFHSNNVIFTDELDDISFVKKINVQCKIYEKGETND